MIKNYVHSYGGDNAIILDMRFVLVSLLGSSEFFWIEVLLQINFKHKQIRGSHLEILFPKSKTDQHREGHIVYISRIESDWCRVKTLEECLKRSIIQQSKGSFQRTYFQSNR